MKRLEVLRNGILLGIDPAVKVAALYSLSAVNELPLYPLYVAEPGTISISSEHAGRYEIGNSALKGFHVYQLHGLLAR